MALYLLDTNILSAAIRNPRGAVARKLSDMDPAALCTSIIVAAEMRFGVAKKGSAALAERVEQALASIEVHAFGEGADRHYGAIRAALERNGSSIGANDMLIAAHALALGATMVTDNLSEFQRVDGLAVENWRE